MSDQVIAEIERSMDGFTDRVSALGSPISCILIYSPTKRAWVVTAHFLNISVEAETPLAVIREFDRELRKRERQQDSLAATLGLEAAE